MKSLVASFTLGLLPIVAIGGAAPIAAEDAPFVAFPENASTLTILEGSDPYLELQLVGWGPSWAWMGLNGRVREVARGTLLENAAEVPGSGARLKLDARVRKAGERRLTVELEVEVSKDSELTYLVAALGASSRSFEDGQVVATLADGTTKETSLPLAKKGIGEKVRRFSIVDADGRKTHVELDPPCDVPSDGPARIVLADGMLRADDPASLRMTIELPAAVLYHASSRRIGFEPGFDEWFEFRPDRDWDRPSEISMAGWLERPAGKHGRVRRDEDRLIYDGQPIRFWGINLCYGACAPDKELADRRARLYSTFGINAVRLHKYADGPGWAGIQSTDSFVDLDPDGLERMDYQVAQFKKHGIYVKLSAHFGSQKLGPADEEYVPYLEEFGRFTGGKRRITTPHSAVHYSPELQDVQIRQTVNLLRHRNPYTGQTYAEDPAIAFIEIINEQSILFYTSMTPLKASPTLRKKVARRFCDWLRKKYSSHEELAKAWGGPKSFDGFVGDGFPAVGEHLDRDNILPIGNPWYWDPDQLDGSQAFRKRRLLDTLRFLYEIQNDFYDRYVKAVRKAGYEGEVISSNWQAGRALSHYYNLHSDARIGTIDRHNYFGGGGGGRIDNSTMLRVPGSGLLSTGMQQVADRPFMLSEWIHVSPNEWGVEGPAIIGAYGMGLQGWDVSFMFQNRDQGTFSDRVGRDRWDVMAPQVLGIFPAVARQVLRGDVSPSKVLATRYVHVPSLDEAKLGFDEKVVQRHDVKAFESNKVPARALAAVRCVVEFTEEYRETPNFDISPFTRGDWIQSSTGELRWKEGDSRLDGFFTLDSPGTKAVVGFAEEQVCELGTVTIEPRCRFAAIYVTAREKDRDVRGAERLLVVAIARARNSGMKVLNDDRILEPGEPPIVLEPVKAHISIRREGTPTVIALDHNGRRTKTALPVSNGSFEIDGARDRTCYYLVEYLRE